MKKIVLCLVLLLALLIPVMAQSNLESQFYSLGNHAFSFGGKGNVPLFFQDTSGNTASTNMSMGAGLTLIWEAYLNNNLIVGADVSGYFNLSPNNNYFYALPILANVGYEFQSMPFSFPLTLGAGMIMTAYQGSYHFDMAIKPAAGFFWHYNTSWSFGTRLSYLWVPQIYLDDSDTDFNESDYTRFGNFMEFNLSVTYHF